MTIRRIERTRDRPPLTVEPRRERRARQSETVAPIRKTERDSVVSNQAIRRAVAILLLHRGPAAILRRVIAIIVHAVERAIGRTWTEIGQEILKGCPSFANTDAAFSVAPIMGITTSAVHRGPSPIFAGVFVRACGAVDEGPHFGYFASQTTTTPRSLLQQVVGSGGHDLAAVTATSPVGVAVLRRIERQHVQPAGTEAGQVIRVRWQNGEHIRGNYTVCEGSR